MEPPFDRLSLARILNTVSEQQQQFMLQFTEMSRALESIRVEIRRTDENHHKEVENLHDLIKQLMQHRISSPQEAQQHPKPIQPLPMMGVTPQQVYNSATSASVFFDPTLQMALKSQQNMQMLQHLQQQQILSGLASGMSPALGTPILPPSQSTPVLTQHLSTPIQSSSGLKPEVVDEEYSEVILKKKEVQPVAEKKPESAAGFGAAYVKKADEWDCQGCYTRCKPDQVQCACCGTNKDGSAGEKDIFSKPTTAAAVPSSSNISFGLGAGAVDKPKVSFGLKPDVEKAPASTSTPDKSKTSFAAAAIAAAKEEPAAVVTPQKAVGFGAAAGGIKFSFGGAASPATVKPGAFSFAKKDDTASPAPSSPFSFKPTTPAPANSTLAGSPAIVPGKSIFGGSSPAATAPSEDKDEQPTSATKIFGAGSSTSMGGGSLAGFVKPAGGSGLFNPDVKEKALQELSKQKSSTFGASVRKDEEDDDDEEEEYEPDVDFKPVIPLPDLIEVKTGEEDETVLFKDRCKLYRYIPESKEWKERGTGEIKILKNPATNSQRVVMRREQTHKLCANFSLSNTMSVSKMVKNPKACLWLCSDFSEGQLSREQLSARFASSELVDDFCRLFNEGAAQSQ